MSISSGGEISISDEMPGPWRQKSDVSSHLRLEYFNLRRYARPLATSSRARDVKASHIISISDEMPGPWRLQCLAIPIQEFIHFNLRRDARPLATRRDATRKAQMRRFQSQT